MSVFIYLIIYFCWLFIKNAERIDHVSLLVKIADIVWTLQAASNIQFITSVTGHH